MWRHPLTHLLAALTLIALVQTFAVKVYLVPTESMTGTLSPGDRILVDRVSSGWSPPTSGDVVVFERPASWKSNATERPAWRVAIGWVGDVFGFGPSNSDALAKRVIAGPGDTITCCDDSGRVVRNGEPLDEPYVTNDLPFDLGTNDCGSSPRSLRCFPPIELGADEYLVLGDNRTASVDSVSGCRGLEQTDDCALTIARDDVIGTVFFRFWPVNAWGAL